MTRNNLFFLLASLLLLTSCVDYDDATHEITARIQLKMPAEFLTTDYEGHEVVLTQNGKRITGITDAQGIVTFTGLIPDVYDISTSWELTADEYHIMTGDDQNVNGCTVSGSLNSQLISQEETILLSTFLSINRDIIIGKIYYAGSKDNNNRVYMAGKYLELYNQSEDSIDVSGLYIGLVEAESTQAYTLQNLHEVYNDSVVLLKQIFRIPVSQPYLVEPGGTVLIVNSAIDHRANNNDMENDLRDADFEAKDYSSNPVQNNPAIPALELTYTMYPAISNLNLVQSGPCSVVIFRTDQNPDSWPKTYPYGKTTGNEWKLMPKRFIIDGVEVLSNKATGVDPSTKRLYNDIDAGYTHIEAKAGWTGEVVYRHTNKVTADGRIILSDTNNSTNDFQVSTSIKPRQYDNN